MRPGVHEISLTGVRLAAETSGDGDPPLVLLHGLAGDRRAWDDIVAALAPGRGLIRYDLRGHGGSVALDHQGYTHTGDLVGLLDALDMERCDLAGVSMGGGVALNFALDHPKRVRRLVLVSPGMTAWEWSERWRGLWTEVIEAARTGGAGAARERWFAHPLFATTRALPEATAKLREALWGYSGAVWTECGGEEAASLPDLDRLPFLAPPTLLLTGAEDLEDFRLIADLIEASAPDAQRIDHAGAGHLLNLERPAEVAAEIEQFLA
jgi:2-succinyl-6-hydroxy-2,4-cyclohexadiene-1-carboxylate synthase